MELSEFRWLLTHVIQINVRNLERNEARFEVLNSGGVEG
jgi:hypothetical protein